MAMFTIRVELHDAIWQDYINLAKRLAQNGIVDVVTADNGKRYKLPPAEYSFEGNASVQQVHDAVVAAAAALGRKFGVVINEVINRSWQGLSFA